MVVANNLVAINAQRQFNIVGNNKKKSTEKLSSGFRINRAADDAAGLAISEKMRRQINGLRRASENIQDGISYVQVADGALDEIHDMLHRINELAVQSANDTNDDVDRQYLDLEVQNLKSEMDRIFSTTSFNEQRIWDETTTPISTTVIEETITDKYPAVIFNSSSSTSYTNNLNKGAAPESSIIVSANDDGITASWTGYNGKKYTTSTIPWDEKLVGSHSFKLSDYMDYSVYPEAKGFDYTYKYTVNEYSTKDQVISAFNQSTSNVGASTYNSVSTTTTYADDSEPKIISTGASITYDAMLSAGKDYEAYDTGFIEFASIVNPALDSVSSSTPLSFKFTMPGIGSVTASVSSAYYTGNYNSSLSDRTGENIWWKERSYSDGRKYKSTVSYTIDGSLDGILSSINNTSGHSLWTDNGSGGSISLSFSLKSDSPFTCLDGKTSTSVGSMTMSFSVKKSDATTMTGLEDYITRAIANLSAVDIDDNDSTSKGYASIYRYSDAKSSIQASHSYTVSHEEHDYPHENFRDIYIQSGTEAGQGIHIRYDNMNTELLGIDELNVLTTDASSEAIDMVKDALEKISEQRSVFGAYQNRLEHSKNIDDNVAENTTAAESRIRDTDMSKEMVQYSLMNILEQAGVSMMAQANQNNQRVLSLLQ